MPVRTLLAALALVVVTPVNAQTFVTEKGRITVSTVAGGLEQPWGIDFLPDGRMIVTEKPGRLRIVSTDGKISTPIDGLPKVDDGGQGGLLDVTLHPDFASNRLVFLSFSEAGRGGASTAMASGRLTDDDTALENVNILFFFRKS